MSKFKVGDFVTQVEPPYKHARPGFNAPGTWRVIEITGQGDMRLRGHASETCEIPDDDCRPYEGRFRLATDEEIAALPINRARTTCAQ